jgi:tetratricopeptide (TPR) repeat protein
MALRLQEARLRGAADKDGRFDTEAISAAFEEAFAWYGLDLEHPDPQQAGEFIRSRSIPLQLTAALDDWAYLPTRDSKGRSQLLAISRLADPDPWRDRLRDVLERQDPRALKELVASARGEDLSPATVVLLARLAQGSDAAQRALAVLRQAQQRYPDDFWLNHELGWCLYRSGTPGLEEAIRYYTAAVALRPQSPGARVNLGMALHHRGKVEEAIACFKKAIDLDPKSAPAHANLGVALHGEGRLDGAVACFQKAIALDPKFAPAHTNLGAALQARGKLDEAIACYKKVIALDPKLAPAHANLGVALKGKGQVDEAIACFQKAIALDPKFAPAHYNLGNALAGKGKVDEAIACFRLAIRYAPKLLQAHYTLGFALQQKGQLDEAVACYRRAISLEPNLPEAHCSLGLVLRRQGRLGESLESLRRGHALGSKRPGWSSPSAVWVRQAERLVLLEKNLAGVLAGRLRPASAAEQIEYARLAGLLRRNRAAADLYACAFAADPKLAANLRPADRYNAACAAALAAAGQGKDADRLAASDRVALRRQALTWLHADLAAWARLLDSGTPADRAALQQMLRHWQHDPDLAVLRDPAALVGLPAGELQACKQFWAEVQNCLVSSAAAHRGGAGATRQPPPRCP